MAGLADLKAALLAVACTMAACSGCAPGGKESASGPAGTDAPPSAATEHAAGRPATRRDPEADRSLTPAPAAYKAYREGTALERRLPLVAIAQFRRALLLDPSFQVARFRLALAASLASLDGEALAALGGIGPAVVDLPEPYRSTVDPLARLAEGDFERALASATAGLDRFPEDADLHLLAGLIASCSCDHFDPDAVIRHLEGAVMPDPDVPAIRRRLVEAYALRGMTDWALEGATRYRDTYPDRAEAIAEVGWVQVARGQYGDALETADEIIRRGEDLLALGLGPAFILQGQAGQLASIYDPEREQAETTQHNALTHLHAGIARIWTGRFDQALTHFERGPEFLPAPWERADKALFFLLQARTLALQGRWREAQASLEAGRQIAGAHPALEYLNGAFGLRQGEPREAERAMSRLAQERRRDRPGWTEPWHRLLAAEISLAEGRPFDALDQARSAWTLEDPLSTDCLMRRTDPIFLDLIARAALEARRPEESLRASEAIRSLGLAGLLHPDLTVLAHFRAGAALEALGRPAEAAARYRQFLGYWGEASSPLAEVAAARASLAAGD